MSYGSGNILRYFFCLVNLTFPGSVYGVWRATASWYTEPSRGGFMLPFELRDNVLGNILVNHVAYFAPGGAIVVQQVRGGPKRSSRYLACASRSSPLSPVGFYIHVALTLPERYLSCTPDLYRTAVIRL